MKLTSYPVLCHGRECGQSAVYKIAAAWSDGVTHELKCYYLACGDCLAELFVQARVKQRSCRLAPGESLEPPGVYELLRGALDRKLPRRVDLERTAGP